MYDPKLWVAVAGLLLGGYLIVPQLVGGDRSAPVREDELAEQVFICRKSGELFVGRARPTPAAHPQTGEPTLMPALYCRRCGKWQATLALEELQRQPAARLCPATREPLQPSGPVPETATRL